MRPFSTTSSTRYDRVDLLVILQNAWRYDAQPGQTEWAPNRAPELQHRAWLRALWASHTGKRLRNILPPEAAGFSIEIGEASPIIGSHASSVFPPDLAHVQKQIDRHHPRVILLLGAQARQLGSKLEAQGLSILTGPHPAYRRLSRKMAAELQASALCRLGAMV